MLVSTPVQVHDIADAVEISAGGVHNLVRLGDGTVRSWGWNGYGQLGDGTFQTRPRPVPVPGLSGVASVSAGSGHSLASLTGEVSVTGGGRESYALQEGRSWTWGYVPPGTLPAPGDTKRYTPMPVLATLSPPAGFSATAMDRDRIELGWEDTGGGDGVLILQAADGVFGAPVSGQAYQAGETIPAGFGESAVWGWGQNLHGQLGDGTTVYRNTPVPVVGGGTVLYLGSGEGFSHTGLEEGLLHQYEAFSFDGSYAYSRGVPARAYTSAPVGEFPWTETFEDESPTRPAWTQVQEEGEEEWVFRAGSSAPAAGLQEAYLGEKNAVTAFTGTHSVTKLVSPLLDLGHLADPVLRFRYNRERRYPPPGGHLSWVNTLNLYYRTDPGAEWVETGVSFPETGSQEWALAEVGLPEPGPSYQIAFEEDCAAGFPIAIDAVAVTGSPAPEASVSGVVSVPGRTDQGGVMITALPHGIHTLSDASGAFFLPGIPPGEIALVFSAPSCLVSRRALLVVSGGAHTLPDPVPLRPGDINGDGVVDILDLTLLASAFRARTGDGNFNEAADLNCDGEINILDLTLLAGSFRQEDE